MNKALIWLHEDALRMTHPIFNLAPQPAEILFIWDNDYLKKMDYSFKRLVFIYESLCELPIKIIEGNSLALLDRHPATHIFVPSTTNPLLRNMITALADKKLVITAHDEPFVKLESKSIDKRFFQFWNKIEKYAFMRDGSSSE